MSHNPSKFAMGLNSKLAARSTGWIGTVGAADGSVQFKNDFFSSHAPGWDHVDTSALQPRMGQGSGQVVGCSWTEVGLMAVVLFL
jgi:hypothetical protein